MKRILLVPSPHVVGQEIEPHLALGLFSLQAVGVKFGDTVDVLDLWADTRGRAFRDSGELTEMICACMDLSEYDVVGLSSMCSTIHYSLMIASRIKERAPHVSV
jgi:hypothetical protein